MQLVEKDKKTRTAIVCPIVKTLNQANSLEDIKDRENEAALPIFYDFMKEALKNKPNLEFRVPKGIKFVRVNPKTGKPATLDDKVVILEALKPDFDFDNNQRVIGDDGTPMLNTNDDSGFELGSEY